MINLNFIINRINYKLGQYLFTAMYGVDDILDELNNTVLDIYTYPVVRDFTVLNYNNTTVIPVPVPTAASYTMDQSQIRDIVQIYIVENGEKTDITDNFKKL